MPDDEDDGDDLAMPPGEPPAEVVKPPLGGGLPGYARVPDERECRPSWYTVPDRPPPSELTSSSTLPHGTFVSYSHSDKAKVQELLTRLERAGVGYWIDKNRLPPGAHFDLEISAKIRNCRYFLACLSSASATRDGYVHKELDLAVDAAKRKPQGTVYIVPVRLDDCELPPSLRHLTRADLFGNAQEHHYQRLVELLSRS